MEIIVERAISKKDYKWLKRDFKKGEVISPLVGYNGKRNKAIKSLPLSELPIKELTIRYRNKEYRVFMTEEGPEYSIFYGKEFPAKYMELLSGIQSNLHLISANNSIEGSAGRTEILKVTISAGETKFEMVSLEDISPSF